MNKEELNSIQELIERKILLAEVSGGLTASDKKFINLWNYTIDLEQQNQQLKEQRQELRSWLGEWLKITEKQYDELNEPVRKSFFKVTIDTLKEVLLKLNELEKKSAESGKNIQ